MSAICISLEEWLSGESIDYLADLLLLCDSAECLWYIRDTAPKEALKEAVKLLPKVNRKRIKDWVIELNNRGVQVVC
ncbi:hypothetical protein NIES4106_62140 (plasmid) [Fischerella sp. NIES-4106]|nr:hypothetical protein NIES4106_62140 [Fischerella sp. NIES-4106]